VFENLTSGPGAAVG